jgi:hypothetical protein
MRQEAFLRVQSREASGNSFPQAALALDQEDSCAQAI